MPESGDSLRVTDQKPATPASTTADQAGRDVTAVTGGITAGLGAMGEQLTAMNEAYTSLVANTGRTSFDRNELRAEAARLDALRQSQASTDPAKTAHVTDSHAALTDVARGHAPTTDEKLPDDVLEQISTKAKKNILTAKDFDVLSISPLRDTKTVEGVIEAGTRFNLNDEKSPYHKVSARATNLTQLEQILDKIGYQEKGEMLDLAKRVLKDGGLAEPVFYILFFQGDKPTYKPFPVMIVKSPTNPGTTTKTASAELARPSPAPVSPDQAPPGVGAAPIEGAQPPAARPETSPLPGPAPAEGGEDSGEYTIKPIQVEVNIAGGMRQVGKTRGEGVQLVEHNVSLSSRQRKTETKEQREQGFFRRTIRRMWWTIQDITSYVKGKEQSYHLHAAGGFTAKGISNEFRILISQVASADVDKHRKSRINKSVRGFIRAASLWRNVVDKREVELMTMLRQALVEPDKIATDEALKALFGPEGTHKDLLVAFKKELTGDMRASSAIGGRLAEALGADAIRTSRNERKERIDFEGTVEGQAVEQFFKNVMARLLTDGLQKGAISEDLKLQTYADIQQFFFSETFAKWLKADERAARNLSYAFSHGTDIIKTTEERLLPHAKAIFEHVQAIANIEEWAKEHVKNNVRLVVNVGEVEAGTGQIRERLLERLTARSMSNERVHEFYSSRAEGIAHFAPEAFKKGFEQAYWFSRAMGRGGRVFSGSIFAAAAVSTALYAAQRAWSLGGNILLPIFGGAAAGAAVRAYNARLEHARMEEVVAAELASGIVSDDKSPIRERITKLLVPMREIQEAVKELQDALKSLNEGQMSEDGLRKALGVIADMRARAHLSDMYGGLELYKTTNYDSPLDEQKNYLFLAQNQVMTQLRTYLASDPGSQQLTNIQKSFNDIQGLDPLLNKLTELQQGNLRVGTAMDTAVATGFGFISMAERGSIEERQNAMKWARRKSAGVQGAIAGAVYAPTIWITHEFMQFVLPGGGRGGATAIPETKSAPPIYKEPTTKLNAAEYWQKMNLDRGLPPDVVRVYNSNGGVTLVNLDGGGKLVTNLHFDAQGNLTYDAISPQGTKLLDAYQHAAGEKVPVFGENGLWDQNSSRVHRWGWYNEEISGKSDQNELRLYDKKVGEHAVRWDVTHMRGMSTNTSGSLPPVNVPDEVANQQVAMAFWSRSNPNEAILVRMDHGLLTLDQTSSKPVSVLIDGKWTNVPQSSIARMVFAENLGGYRSASNATGFMDKFNVNSSAVVWETRPDGSVDINSLATALGRGRIPSEVTLSGPKLPDIHPPVEVPAPEVVSPPTAERGDFHLLFPFIPVYYTPLETGKESRKGPEATPSTLLGAIPVPEKVAKERPAGARGIDGTERAPAVGSAPTGTPGTTVATRSTTTVAGTGTQAPATTPAPIELELPAEIVVRELGDIKKGERYVSKKGELYEVTKIEKEDEKVIVTVTVNGETKTLTQAELESNPLGKLVDSDGKPVGLELYIKAISERAGRLEEGLGAMRNILSNLTTLNIDARKSAEFMMELLTRKTAAGEAMSREELDKAIKDFFDREFKGDVGRLENIQGVLIAGGLGVLLEISLKARTTASGDELLAGIALPESARLTEKSDIKLGQYIFDPQGTPRKVRSLGTKGGQGRFINIEGGDKPLYEAEFEGWTDLTPETFANFLKRTLPKEEAEQILIISKKAEADFEQYQVDKKDIYTFAIEAATYMFEQKQNGEPLKEGQVFISMHNFLLQFNLEGKSYDEEQEIIESVAELHAELQSVFFKPEESSDENLNELIREELTENAEEVIEIKKNFIDEAERFGIQRDDSWKLMSAIISFQIDNEGVRIPDGQLDKDIKKFAAESVPDWEKKDETEKEKVIVFIQQSFKDIEQAVRKEYAFDFVIRRKVPDKAEKIIQIRDESMEQGEKIGIQPKFLESFLVFAAEQQLEPEDERQTEEELAEIIKNILGSSSPLYKQAKEASDIVVTNNIEAFMMGLYSKVGDIINPPSTNGAGTSTTTDVTPPGVQSVDTTVDSSIRVSTSEFGPTREEFLANPTEYIKPGYYIIRQQLTASGHYAPYPYMIKSVDSATNQAIVIDSFGGQFPIAKEDWKSWLLPNLRKGDPYALDLYFRTIYPKQRAEMAISIMNNFIDNAKRENPEITRYEASQILLVNLFNLARLGSQPIADRDKFIDEIYAPLIQTPDTVKQTCKELSKIYFDQMRGLYSASPIPPAKSSGEQPGGTPGAGSATDSVDSTATQSRETAKSNRILYYEPKLGEEKMVPVYGTDQEAARLLGRNLNERDKKLLDNGVSIDHIRLLDEAGRRIPRTGFTDENINKLIKFIRDLGVQAGMEKFLDRQLFKPDNLVQAILDRGETFVTPVGTELERVRKGQPASPPSESVKPIEKQGITHETVRKGDYIVRNDGTVTRVKRISQDYIGTDDMIDNKSTIGRVDWKDWQSLSMDVLKNYIKTEYRPEGRLRALVTLNELVDIAFKENRMPVREADQVFMGMLLELKDANYQSFGETEIVALTERVSKKFDKYYTHDRRRRTFARKLYDSLTAPEVPPAGDNTPPPSQPPSGAPSPADVTAAVAAGALIPKAPEPLPPGQSVIRYRNKPGGGVAPVFGDSAAVEAALGHVPPTDIDKKLLGLGVSAEDINFINGLRTELRVDKGDIGNKISALIANIQDKRQHPVEAMRIFRESFAGQQWVDTDIIEGLWTRTHPEPPARQDAPTGAVYGVSAGAPTQNFPAQPTGVPSVPATPPPALSNGIPTTTPTTSMPPVGSVGGGIEFTLANKVEDLNQNLSARGLRVMTSDMYDELMRGATPSDILAKLGIDLESKTLHIPGPIDTMKPIAKTRIADLQKYYKLTDLIKLSKGQHQSVYSPAGRHYRLKPESTDEKIIVVSLDAKLKEGEREEIDPKTFLEWRIETQNIDPNAKPSNPTSPAGSEPPTTNIRIPQAYSTEPPRKNPPKIKRDNLVVDSYTDGGEALTFLGRRKLHPSPRGGWYFSPGSRLFSYTPNDPFSWIDSQTGAPWNPRKIRFEWGNLMWTGKKWIPKIN